MALLYFGSVGAGSEADLPVPSGNLVTLNFYLDFDAFDAEISVMSPYD